MNLRKEIEKLIFWYLIALIIAMPIGYILTLIAKGQTAGFIIAYVVFPISFIMSHLENLVVAFWISQIAKQSNQRYILWTLFGLVAHLFAVVIFIALNIVEEKFNFSKEKYVEVPVETDL